MKQFFIILLFSISLISYGQVPQGINYQAVIRDPSTNSVLTNTTVTLKFKLFQGSSSTSVYEEEHSALPIGNSGVVTCTIGINSTVVSGVFSSINWSLGNIEYEVHLDIANNGSFQLIGNRQKFMTVPYAFYAEKAGNIAPTTTIAINAPNTVTNTATGGYTINIPTYSLSQNTNSISLTQSTSSGTINAGTFSIPSTSVVAGNNINVSNFANTYSISSPSYSLTSSSNTLTLTNGNISTTATVPAVSNYTSGTGISMSGTAPNYTIVNSAPAFSTSLIAGQNVTVTPTTPSNSYTISSPTYSVNKSGNLISFTKDGSTISSFSLSPTYTAGTGIAITSGSIISNSVPSYSLTKNTTLDSLVLTNGVDTSKVSLPNGIYGGSGALQTGSTTVSIGSNTLTFLSGIITNKPIANFFGGGISGTHLAIGHINSKNASIKFYGNANSVTPIEYGSITAGSFGLSMGPNSNLNALSTSTNGNVLINTINEDQGRLQIAHSSSTVNPHVNIISPTGLNYGRLKYSNQSNVSYFTNEAVSIDGDMPNSAYSISYNNGTGEKPIFLINGNRQVYINAYNTALTTFHVMDKSLTGNGIMSEGFAQPGKIIIARNNNAGSGARAAVVSGDELGQLVFSGYAAGSTYTGDGARITAVATEAFTNSSNGTELIFNTVPKNNSISKEVLRLTQDGNAQLTNALVMKNSLMVQSTSNSGEGKIYFDNTSRKFKVSQDGNAFVDLVSASPWAQFAGKVALANINDFVGIGTNSPSFPLHVINSGTVGSSVVIDNNNNSFSALVTNNGTGGGISSAVNSTSYYAITASNSGDGGAIQGITSTNGKGVAIEGLNLSNTLGNAARFEIQNANNNADALIAKTVASGAAIRAITSSTNTNSALSLLLENGHIKAIGPSVTWSNLNAVGGFSISAPALSLNSNDVKGIVEFDMSTITILSPGAYVEITINFAKPYSSGSLPVVSLTPSVDLQGLDYFVATASTHFTIRVYKVSGSTTTSITPSTFKFNYFVIE